MAFHSSVKRNKAKISFGQAGKRLCNLILSKHALYYIMWVMVNYKLYSDYLCLVNFYVLIHSD